MNRHYTNQSLKRTTNVQPDTFKLTKRGFKKLSENAIIPTRATKKSAGYDLYVPLNSEDIVIKPGCVGKFATDVAAYMNEDEFLAIVVRSSIGIKKKLILENQVGIIDSDYFGNPDNGGNIYVSFRNIGDDEVVLRAGERVAQGIFMKYLTVDDDTPLSEQRLGGIGSTNQ